MLLSRCPSLTAMAQQQIHGPVPHHPVVADGADRDRVRMLGVVAEYRLYREHHSDGGDHSRERLSSFYVLKMMKSEVRHISIKSTTFRNKLDTLDLFVCYHDSSPDVRRYAAKMKTDYPLQSWDSWHVPPIV